MPPGRKIAVIGPKAKDKRRSAPAAASQSDTKAKKLKRDQPGLLAAETKARGRMVTAGRRRERKAVNGYHGRHEKGHDEVVVTTSQMRGDFFKEFAKDCTTFA
jgi:hypothetical protein